MKVIIGCSLCLLIALHFGGEVYLELKRENADLRIRLAENGLECLRMLEEDKP